MKVKIERKNLQKNKDQQKKNWRKEKDRNFFNRQKEKDRKKLKSSNLMLKLEWGLMKCSEELLT